MRILSGVVFRIGQKEKIPLPPPLEHSHLPPGATWGNLVAEWAAREHIMNVTIDYGGDLWRLRVHLA